MSLEQLKEKLLCANYSCENILTKFELDRISFKFTKWIFCRQCRFYRNKIQFIRCKKCKNPMEYNGKVVCDECKKNWKRNYCKKNWLEVKVKK